MAKTRPQLKGGRILLQLASTRASGPGSVEERPSCPNSRRRHPTSSGIVPVVHGGPRRGYHRRPHRPAARPRRLPRSKGPNQKRYAAILAAPGGGLRPQVERGDRRRYWHPAARGRPSRPAPRPRPASLPTDPPPRRPSPPDPGAFASYDTASSIRPDRAQPCHGGSHLGDRRGRLPEHTPAPGINRIHRKTSDKDFSPFHPQRFSRSTRVPDYGHTYDPKARGRYRARAWTSQPCQDRPCTRISPMHI